MSYFVGFVTRLETSGLSELEGRCLARLSAKERRLVQQTLPKIGIWVGRAFREQELDLRLDRVLAVGVNRVCLLAILHHIGRGLDWPAKQKVQAVGRELWYSQRAHEVLAHSLSRLRGRSRCRIDPLTDERQLLELGRV